MIYDLVPEKDPILTEEMPLFDFDDPIVDPEELFENMKETMVSGNGIGLSANQVGIRTSMFVFGNPDDPDTIASVFNPKITDWDQENEVPLDEGCLSFPNLFIRIYRPEWIRCRYTTHENITDTIKFNGMTARIFQHEFDHLKGIKFTQRAKKIHLDRARKNRKIMNRRG